METNFAIISASLYQQLRDLGGRNPFGIEHAWKENAGRRVAETT
jgi:hypothetical protein